MDKNLSYKFSQYYALFFLAFAPWYDNVVHLPSPNLPGPYLSQLTDTGLGNIINVSLCFLALSVPLFFSFRDRKPEKGEAWIFLWPLLNILNFRVLDTPGVITLYNSFFISACILCLLRSKDVMDGMKLVFKKGFPVFLASYSIALLAPFLIPLKSHPIFLMCGDVERYRGWSGIGSLSFGGFTIGMWGLMNFLAEPSSGRQRKIINLCAILLGVLGLTLTVLRIGWAALLATLLWGMFHCLRRGRKRDALLLVLVFMPSFSSFYISNLNKKARLPNFNMRSALFEVDLSDAKKNLSVLVHGENQAEPAAGGPADSKGIPGSSVPTSASMKAQKINPTAEPTDGLHNLSRDLKGYLWRFDVYTNGRVGIFYLLFPKFIEHPIFGFGTGGAGRLLREIKYSTLEAHNEYLRLLLDHGLCGIVILANIALLLLRRLKGSVAVGAFIGMGIIMLTDNYLIYPSFGYGPLFIALSIVSYAEQRAGKTS